MSESMETDEKTGNFACKLTEDMPVPKMDRVKMGVNPFLQQLEIPVTKIADPGKFIRDEDGTMLPAHMFIEKQKAMRVYRIAGAKERALNLSAGALRMLVYIQYTIEAAEDGIVMTPEQYQRAKCGTRNVYKKAIQELHRYGYISPTAQKYVYWVNPALMYAGNRIRKWPEKVIVKNEKD